MSGKDSTFNRWSSMAGLPKADENLISESVENEQVEEVLNEEAEIRQIVRSQIQHVISEQRRLDRVGPDKDTVDALINLQQILPLSKETMDNVPPGPYEYGLVLDGKHAGDFVIVKSKTGKADGVVISKSQFKTSYDELNRRLLADDKFIAKHRDFLVDFFDFEDENPDAAGPAAEKPDAMPAVKAALGGKDDFVSLVRGFFRSNKVPSRGGLAIAQTLQEFDDKVFTNELINIKGRGIFIPIPGIGSSGLEAAVDAGKVPAGSNFRLFPKGSRNKVAPAKPEYIEAVVNQHVQDLKRRISADQVRSKNPSYAIGLGDVKGLEKIMGLIAQAAGDSKLLHSGGIRAAEIAKLVARAAGRERDLKSPLG